MVNVGVTLEHHELVDLHGTGLTQAPEIVAFEVNQHHMLGLLLRVRPKLRGKRGIVGCIAWSAWTGAGDGAGIDLQSLHPYQTFRRGGQYRQPRQRREPGERPGVGSA